MAAVQIMKQMEMQIYKAKNKFVQFNGLEKSTFGMIPFYYPI